MREKKSFHHYMRLLHRDIGFLTIGLIICYALSGIVLIYRDTDFMKQTVNIEKTLPMNLSSGELGLALKLKNIKVIGEDSVTINFVDGTYSKTTGLANYRSKEVMFPFNKFIALHKAASQTATHWVTTLFAVSLIFLAVSSFWMFKFNSKSFKRGVLLVVVGAVFWVILLFAV